MDEQISEVLKRLEQVENKLSEVSMRLDAIEPRSSLNTNPTGKKKPKGKLFLYICLPILLLCLLTGGFFAFRSYQKSSNVEPEIGDVITFGQYEQNNSIADGPEPIEWIVLDKREGKTLLLSKYILFRSSNSGIAWLDSSLRNTLNSDFYSSAFTPGDQAKICTVSIEANDYTSTDKIFLLSTEEVVMFFPTDESRQCTSTPSAVEASVSASASQTWWLRTYSLRNKHSVNGGFQFVMANGEIEIDTSYSKSTSLGVRPALWLDTTK